MIHKCLKSGFTYHYSLRNSERGNEGVISDKSCFSLTLCNTSLFGLNTAVELQMYGRVNPIKHNVTTDGVIKINVFGSFD